MVMKQYKKIVLSLVLVVQGCSVVSMVPAQEQGVLSALVSDAVSLAKGIGYCLSGMAQGLGKTYLLAREYPKSALAIAASVPLLGRWVYVKQYNEHIKPIADRARGDDRTYTKWAANLWENQSTVNRDQNQVLNAFKADFGTPNQAILNQLAQEIAALAMDMQELETKYLVCKGPLDITLYNIRKEFRAAKDMHALGIGEEKLNFDQSLRVDAEINKTIGSKVLPYLFFSINYGQAARLWCTLKKTQLRLKVLLHLLKPTVSGDANIPPINRSANVVDHNVNLTASRQEA